MSSRFVVSLAALATLVAPLAPTVDGQERHLAGKRTASAGVDHDHGDPLDSSAYG